MLAAGMTLTLCGIGLGFDDLIRIGALVLLLPLISRLLTRRQRVSVTVRRASHPALVGVGQPASVLVSLQNEGTRPTPVLLAQEHVAPALGDAARVVVPSIRRGRSWEFGYPIRATRRGRHLVGPLELHRRDVFGLALSTIVLPEAVELVALPVVQPLAGSSVTIGTGTEGTNPTQVALHGEDDASLRGYQQGDDLRRIHWPVTAHRGELMVRQEGRPTLRRALVVIGGYAAPPVGGAVGGAAGGAAGGRGHGRGTAAGSSALDWMIEALASVSVHLAATGYALHVLTPETLQADTASVRLSPTQALRTLAVVEPDRRGHPGLRGRLTAAARELAGQGGVVVTAVSDHDEATVHDVLSMKGGTAPGVLFVLDSPSFATGRTDGPGGSDGTGDWGGPAGWGAGSGTASTRAQQLTGLARSGGWRAVAVRRGDSVRTHWSALTVSAAAAAPERAGTTR